MIDYLHVPEALDPVSPHESRRGPERSLAQLCSPISGHVLELIAFRDIPPGREDYGPTRPGFGHLSFVVDDLEAAVAAVADLGGRLLEGLTPFDGDRRAYCWEPSGTVVEFVERGERG